MELDPKLKISGNFFHVFALASQIQIHVLSGKFPSCTHPRMHCWNWNYKCLIVSQISKFTQSPKPGVCNNRAIVQNHWLRNKHMTLNEHWHLEIFNHSTATHVLSIFKSKKTFLKDFDWILNFAILDSYRF